MRNSGDYDLEGKFSQPSSHIGIYFLVVTLPVMFVGVQLMFEYRQAPPSGHASHFILIISATERKNCETELFADDNFFIILTPVRPLLSNICCYNHNGFFEMQESLHSGARIKYTKHDSINHSTAVGARNKK